MQSVAVLVIATGRYIDFVPRLFSSLDQHFLVGEDVTYILFTDATDFRAGCQRKVEVCPAEHLPWPGVTLGRYRTILRAEPRLKEFTHLYYLDADCLCTGPVGREILGDLVAVDHPWPIEPGQPETRYESRPESCAYVHPMRPLGYKCGAFQGGAKYLEAVRDMAQAIEEDTRNGLTAVWHDESHWNRYLTDHPPTTVLDNSYMWHEQSPPTRARLIQTVTKSDHQVKGGPPKKLKIAAYGIAKDELKNVLDLGERLKGADYILVGDTGSTDGTQDCLRTQDIEVVDIRIDPWRFDHARQAALEALPADIDICVSIDMDEQLSPGFFDQLRAEFAARPTATRATYDYHWHSGVGAPWTYRTDRIHHRHGYRWVYPCHECVKPLSTTREEIIRSTVTIVHPVTAMRDHPGYLPLLRLAVEEHPTDARALFYLIRELGAAHTESPSLIRRCLHHDQERTARRAQVLRWKAESDADPTEALHQSLAACENGGALYRLAKHHLAKKRWSAAHHYGMLSQSAPNDSFHGDPEVRGGHGFWVAAVAAWHLGLPNARELWARACAMSPDNQKLKESGKWFDPPTAKPQLSPGLLTVIIPAIPGRPAGYRLFERLSAQARQYGRAVEVLYLADNRVSDLAEKRNSGVQLARGEYVSFVDDDDDVADDYVAKLVDQLEDRTADVVSFDVDLDYDGTAAVLRQVHGHPYEPWTPQADGKYPRVLRRPPSQVAAWRRAIILDTPYTMVRDATGAAYEDLEWAGRALPKVRTAKYIPEQLYRYIYRSATSVTRVPPPEFMATGAGR